MHSPYPDDKDTGTVCTTASVVASSPIVDHASYAPELHSPQPFPDKERYEEISDEQHRRFWWSPHGSHRQHQHSSTSSSSSTSLPRRDDRRHGGRRNGAATFWLSAALVLVITVAIAVGGAVGITTTQNLQRQIAQLKTRVAEQQALLSSSSSSDTTSSSSPTSSNTTSSTTNTTLSISTPSLLPTTCVSNTSYQVARTCDIYTYACASTFNSLFWGAWLFNTTAPTMQACIEICDTYNYCLRSRDSNQDNMTAVIYGASDSQDRIYFPGSCFCAHANADAGLMPLAGVDMAIRQVWNRNVC